MKNTRTTAEQIRPIIQAMERSIESARRRRLHGTGDTGATTPEPRSTNDEARDTIDQPRGLYRLELAAAVLRTWRMPVGDEPGDGIWHQRYYAEGSKLRR